MDMKFKEVSFHKNEILFGHDSTPFITAVEYDGNDGVEIFFRTKLTSDELSLGLTHEEDEVTSKKETFKPFILLEHTQYMDGWKGTYEAKSLTGDSYYKYLTFFE